MKLPFSSVIKVVLFACIGFGILYMLYNSQSAAYLEECKFKNIPEADCNLMDKLISDFKSVKLFWIIVVAAIFMLSNLFRALRWNQMLSSIGLRPRLMNSLGALMVGYFANLGVPRLGEVLKVGIISKYDNLPVDKVMGTVILDRVIDLILFALAILLGFLVSFDIFSQYFQENFQFSTQQVLGGLVALATLGLLCLWLAYKFIFLKITEQSAPLLQKIKKMIYGFVEGIQSVFKLERPGLFWMYSIGIWICYYLMTYLCFFAFEPTMGFGPKVALVVFLFGTLGIVIPTPGGVGSYQYLVSQALLIYGLNSVDAFSFANILFFTISIFCNVIFGIIFLVLLPLYNSKYPVERA